MMTTQHADPVAPWLTRLKRSHDLQNLVEIDKGISNRKFRCERSDGSSALLRINQKGTPETILSRFEKAKFCSELFSKRGLPVPQVFEVELLGGEYPYSVEAWVEGGCVADDILDPAKRAVIWQNLGEFSRALGKIDLKGQEQDFNLGFDGESATQTWNEYLTGVEPLILADTILGFSQEEKKGLTQKLWKLDLEKYPMRIAHGDLKLDNVLVDPETLEIIAVLDLELARFVPHILGECSTTFEPAVLDIKKNAVAREFYERKAFLKGCGYDYNDVVRDVFAYAASEVFLNLGFYDYALNRSTRTDKDLLKTRLKNYVKGAREDLDPIRDSFVL